MYSEDFIKAFNHVMLIEVGSWFDPTCQATQKGLIDTHDNRVKCGYVNDPNDHGGETKFGIAQKFITDLCVRDATLEQAQKVYYDRYWIQSGCDRIPSPLDLLHFDTAVNMGVGTAVKFLQTEVGAKADGSFGPATIAALIAVNKNMPTLCSEYLDLRQKHYNDIIARDPSQARFANGWKNRNDALRVFLNVK
jgi:lysozyme family protein